jgi:hypothetical protein
MAWRIGEVDHQEIPASDEKYTEVEKKSFAVREAPRKFVPVRWEDAHGLRGRHFDDKLGSQAGV